MARAKGGGERVCLRGGAKGVELENRTLFNLMLAVKKPFRASVGLGKLFDKARP